MIRVRQLRYGYSGARVIRTFGRGSNSSGRCPDDPGLRLDDPGGSTPLGISSRGRIWGRKWMILGSKLRGFRGWKVGKLVGKLDPLETKRIHGSKSTKSHQTNRSQNFLGLFLVGNFRIWGRTQQNKARKRWGGSKFVMNQGS